MRPFSELRLLAHQRVVAFDLDDTLLTHGALTLEAYEALFMLKRAGFGLLGATGRPASWGVVVARQWPIEGCIVENGGMGFFGGTGRAGTWDPLTASERTSHTQKLVQLAARALGLFPDIGLADDAPGRVSDLAWDIAEYAKVPEVRIGAFLQFLAGEGAQTTRSSVHVHATFGSSSKATGIVHFAKQAFGLDPKRRSAALCSLETVAMTKVALLTSKTL